MHRKKERAPTARGPEEPHPAASKQKKPPIDESEAKAVARVAPAAAPPPAKKSKKAYWREHAFTTIWEQLSPAEKGQATKVRSHLRTLCSPGRSAGMENRRRGVCDFIQELAMLAPALLTPVGLTKEDVALATQFLRCKVLFKEKQDIWFQFMTALIFYPWNSLSEGQFSLNSERCLRVQSMRLGFGS